MKWSMMSTALYYGAKNLNVSTRNDFFKALIKTHSYLYGFHCEEAISLAYFTKLWFRFNILLSTDPIKINGFFAKNGYKQETYVQTILNTYPEVLHKLYRYAIRVLGPSARTATIVSIMNDKCKVLFPQGFMNSVLKLNSYHFKVFFNTFKGKLIRPISKPRLTEEHKRNRVLWAKKWKKRISDATEEFYYCYLDEKWFYTTSRRKKVKVLPRAPFETEEEAYVPMPRLRSRRFPTKVMVQGIVACPIEEHDFDGKIYLERVSESYHSTRNSFNQNISKYYEVNYELKNGGWKDLFLPYEMFADMNIRDAIESIGEVYELEDIDDLCFSFKNYSCTGVTKKWVRMLEGTLLQNRFITDKHAIRRPLSMDDLTLHRNIKPGTTLLRDTNCNSRYMLENVHSIGKAIRKAYHWTNKKEVPIYLILDNAGGHGTIETKQQYEETLK